MNITVKRLEKAQWLESGLSEYAHRISFAQVRPGEVERIDYALLGVNEAGGQVMGYMTCMELDSRSVYWQFGGAFPPALNTVHCFRGYQAFRDWHSVRYERAMTYIENSNATMLKMAAKVGFLITGVRLYTGKILLEHTLEFGDKK